jgi:hypothetical protein
MMTRNSTMINMTPYGFSSLDPISASLGEERRDDE